MNQPVVGSGMVIVNPPEGYDEALSTLGIWLNGFLIDGVGVWRQARL